MRSLNARENIQLAKDYLLKFNKIEKFPYQSREIIATYQLDKIKQLINLAYYHTEFYRQKYSKLDIYPEDIKTWKDFKKLPTVTKEEIIQFRDQCVVDSRRNDPNLILSRSSGSSGKMLNLWMDGQFFIDKALTVHRMYKDLTDYNPLDKQVLMYTSEYPYRSIMGFYKVYYINNLTPLKQMFEFLKKINPNLITGYPSILLEMINEYGDLLKQNSKIRVVCTNSEQSTQEQRNLIGRAFNCKVYDEYSTEELSKCALQCRYLNYHLQEDSAYIEILDEDSDSELDEGIVGEIVGTSLHNMVMPFIRYRQGDLSSVKSSDCKCGKNMRVLENLSGRKGNSFKLSSGKIIPTGKILDWTYKLFLDFNIPILQFQVIQEKIDTIKIVIIPEEKYNSNVQDNLIINSFKNEFGNFLSVGLVKVNSIPKTSAGKHIPIHSLIQS